MKTIAWLSIPVLTCAALSCDSGGEGLRVIVDPACRLLRLDLPDPDAGVQALSGGPGWGRSGPRVFGLEHALALARARAPRDALPPPAVGAAEIDLTLRPVERNLSGRALFTVDAVDAEIASLTFALDAQAVDAVNATGPTATFAYAGSVLTVTPATPVPAGQSWTLEVLWHDGEIEHYIDAFAEGGGRVLANLLGPDSTFFTYGYSYFPDPLEARGAADWTFRVTIPADRTLILAGSRGATADNPDGTRTETWSLVRAPRAAMPLALAAYERADANCGPVALEIYGIPGESIDHYPIVPATYGPVLAELCQGLTAMFGAPLVSAVRLVGVDERFASGIAFRGLILVPNYTWDDDGSGSFPRRDFYLAHELSHQWWEGGMAAAARDLWLIEGTADFAALAVAGERGGDEAALWLWLWEVEPLLSLYRLGEPEEPLVPEAGVAVDPRITYVKGAWVLRMLEDAAGAGVVTESLRAMREAHLTAPFSSEDFTARVDSAAGQDLSWFHEQWLHGLGLLELAEEHAAAGAALQIQIDQRRVWAGSPERYFRAPLTLRAEQAGRSTEDEFLLEGASQAFELPLP